MPTRAAVARLTTFRAGGRPVRWRWSHRDAIMRASASTMAPSTRKLPKELAALMKEIYQALQNGSRRLVAMGIRSALDQVLTNITFVEQRGLSVEYAMVRQQNGLPYSYAVIFMLDDDGIWRIKAL